MTVWIKRGVLGDLSHAMQKGLGRVIDLYSSKSLDFFITSFRDGNHSAHSLHYIGNAVDFRKDPKVSRREMQGILGKDFDVVVESMHVHVEYDPKG